MPKASSSFWLLKSEPESRLVNGFDVSFSFDDLEQGEEPWNGIRNYEARNLINRMKPGDYCLFYHSNCKVPGVVGIAQVSSEPEPDLSALDCKSPYYDPKSSMELTRWYQVRIRFIKRLGRFVGLKELKADPFLAQMTLIKRGRLSVQPVTLSEFNHVLKLSETTLSL